MNAAIFGLNEPGLVLVAAAQATQHGVKNVAHGSDLGISELAEIGKCVVE